MLLVNFLDPRQTLSGDHYVSLLEQVQVALTQKQDIVSAHKSWVVMMKVAVLYQ